MRRGVLVTAALAAALAPAAAHAAPDQESTFQDDNHLLYAPRADVARTMDTLQALGADRLRLTVLWKLVAPSPSSKTKPAGFDASDPDAYPPGTWDRYQTAIDLAAARGMAVNLNVTVPAPLWATGSPDRKDIEDRYAPSAQEFGAFVRAAARRFPQVHYWSIQNEPNQPGWLDPQWAPDPRNPKHLIEAAPTLYRAMVDSAWQALQETGHSGDTILIGETAPKGQLDRGETRALSPGRFILRLYCLDDHGQFLKGAEAQVRGCPASNDPTAFRSAHPGLFAATGYAHHPYELLFAPDRPPPHRDWYTMANLKDLSGLLRRIRGRYQLGGSFPLYLTEFGYQTNPPDPLGVTPRQQAAYLNQSEYLAWRNRNVRTLSQFLLVDDPPVAGVKRSSPVRWRTFQSGLEYQDGSFKPARRTYGFPVFLPKRRVRRGRRLEVWGLLRRADDGAAHRVDVLFKPRGAKRRYRRIARATAEPLHGYIDKRVRVRRSGAIKLRWDGQTTRAVSFRLRRAKAR